MQEVHLTFEDLTLTRTTATLGPFTESLFALNLLQHKIDDAFTAWRKQVQARLGTRLSSFLNIAGKLSPLADLISVTRTPSDHIKVQLAARDGKALPSRQLTDEIHEFYDIAVRPYWPRVYAYLEAEREVTGQAMISGGFDQAFRSLHRSVRWKSPVLTLPHVRPSKVVLSGTGVVLVPSLFLHGTPMMFHSKNSMKASVLVYPVTPNSLTSSLLWADQTPEQSLSALVGNTRATVLQSLTDSRTTTEIAERVGISAASASQHATVLRNAGLVATHRTRTAAIHTLTPLGIALFTAAH